MNISVLGCGRWGTFLAWYAHKIGHKVHLWGREESNSFKTLSQDRKNQYLTISPEIELSHSLLKVISQSKIILISISAQNLRSLAKQIGSLNIEKKLFVLCMKGIEADSGKRLTQVFSEETKYESAIWVGPGHVQDYVNDIPNCMVVGSHTIEHTKQITEVFGSDLIRFYYGQDMIGNEIGAAAKNVIGIAAGMLDGLKYSSLKGALMARGTREISKLVRAMGGNELTIYGLSHLGDYEATLFSPHSHNRAYGEALVQNRPFTKLAEGVSTSIALQLLSKSYEVDLPICSAVFSITNLHENPKEVLTNLFLRSRKFEF